MSVKITLTKMEAIGELCTIKADIDIHIENLGKQIEEATKKGADYDERPGIPWMKEYQKQLQRQSRALEMAGTAMTR